MIYTLCDLLFVCMDLKATESYSLDLIVAQELGCFVVPHGSNESMGTFIDQVPRQEQIVNSHYVEHAEDTHVCL